MQGGRGVSSGVPALSARVRRPSDAIVLCREAYRALRQGAHLPQARGSSAYGRTQDQQCARAGAARKAHGQEAHRRRDGRRAARRRLGDGRGALRHGVPCFHGGGGRQAPAPQRLPHGTSGREGHSRRERHGHAQGRDERGDPLLGDEYHGHLLHHRLGGRAAPVPEHGARLPEDDRRGDPRTGQGGVRTASRCARRLRRRRQQRHRHVL